MQYLVAMKGMKRAVEFNELIPCKEERIMHHDFSEVVALISKDFGVKDVIDFGCGDGALCRSFSKEGYLGIDIDEEILNIAKSRFTDYQFTTPKSTIYSTEMFMACRVLSALSEDKIHEIMKNVRCKWLLVAESFGQSHLERNIHSFFQRDLENYKKIMRAHDLLLFQHKTKLIGSSSPKDVSFLLFKRCGRNPTF